MIRQAWRDRTRELRETGRTLRNLGVEVGVIEGGSLLAFPLITVKVSALIYWQALVLLLKRTPFYTHPAKIGTNHP